MQKLIHQFRHKYVLKTQLERIDNIFVDSIWLGRKHNMKKNILQKPWPSMGIGLRNFSQVITAAKTIDYKNFLTLILPAINTASFVILNFSPT